MEHTDSHEWLERKGNIGTVGITDAAQKELGEIVFIQLPKVGQKLKKGEEAAVLESTKAAVDVYSPAAGKVIEINEKVRATPGLVNQSAESSGWLFRLEL